MLRYQTVQNRRVTWEPIIRARIQEQQIEEQEAQALSTEPSGTAAQPTQKRQKHPQISIVRLVGGLALIVLGFYLLEQQGIRIFSQLLPEVLSSVQWPAWMLGIGGYIQTWREMFSPTFNQLSSLSNQDPRYLYLFATVVIGLASLPLLFYLIERLSRRIFP